MMSIFDRGEAKWSYRNQNVSMVTTICITLSAVKLLLPEDVQKPDNGCTLHQLRTMLKPIIGHNVLPECGDTQGTAPLQNNCSDH